MFALYPSPVGSEPARPALPDLSATSPACPAPGPVGLRPCPGRTTPSRRVAGGRRLAEIDSARYDTSRLILQLAEGRAPYVDGHFDQALRTHEAVMREGSHGEATRDVAYQWRCELLAGSTASTRSVQLIAEGIASPDTTAKDRALDFFETWRAGNCSGRGRVSSDAAAAWKAGRSHTPQVVGTL